MFSKFVLATTLALFTLGAQAAVIKIPEGKAAVSINVPDKWEPETYDRGVLINSPDGTVTVSLDFAKSDKDIDSIVDEAIEWLVKEQGVKVNGKSGKDIKGTVGGIASEGLVFDATHKEYGPARVGFLFTPIASGLLITTYWVDKKGADKSVAEVNRILGTVRALR